PRRTGRTAGEPAPGVVTAAGELSADLVVDASGAGPACRSGSPRRATGRRPWTRCASGVDHRLDRTAVGRLPRGDLRDRRLVAGSPPGVQVRPGPDHAALDPPVPGAGTGWRDPEVQVARARVAGTADQSERLAGCHPQPGTTVASTDEKCEP